MTSCEIFGQTSHKKDNLHTNVFNGISICIWHLITLTTNWVADLKRPVSEMAIRSARAILQNPFIKKP